MISFDDPTGEARRLLGEAEAAADAGRLALAAGRDLTAWQSPAAIAFHEAAHAQLDRARMLVQDCADDAVMLLRSEDLVLLPAAPDDGEDG